MDFAITNYYRSNDLFFSINPLTNRAIKYCIDKYYSDNINELERGWTFSIHVTTDKVESSLVSKPIIFKKDKYLIYKLDLPFKKIANLPENDFLSVYIDMTVNGIFQILRSYKLDLTDEYLDTIIKELKLEILNNEKYFADKHQEEYTEWSKNTIKEILKEMGLNSDGSRKKSNPNL